VRPDDLAVQMVNAVLAETPQLDPRDIEDLVLGSAQLGGEAGYNLARVVAVLAGMDHLPGTTVNRFCASSL
jgi:acetyl-CoA C-acetyltransferase